MELVYQHRGHDGLILEKFDIENWVKAESPVTERPAFRQAVHTVLTAISKTPYLQTSMIMKGGILLAFIYESPRYTKDIDFSTSTKLSDFDFDKFKNSLEEGLIDAVETLGYGLDCRIQKIEQSPPRADATFPTIKANIGYAYKNNSAALKRLISGKSTHVVGLDYSLNELVGDIASIELEHGSIIKIYDTVELVAEKFRALLQQQVRKRVRGQDIYDLYHVLTKHSAVNGTITKEKICRRLIEKSVERNLPVSLESMSNPEIIRRTKEGYNALASLIDEDLLPFDLVYKEVEKFYRSLPWG